MKKLLILFLVLICSVGYAAQFGPYDPGAIRTDGGNAADLVDFPNRVRAVFASITTDLDVGGDVTIGGDLTGVNASFTGDLEIAGDLLAADGTAAAPSITFADDTDTGIYRATDDILSLSTAGIEAWRVNANQEMLIATSTDAGDYKLQVAGNSLYTGTLFGDSSGFYSALLRGGLSGADYVGIGNDGTYARIQALNAALTTGKTLAINPSTQGNILLATSTDDLTYRVQVGGSAKMYGFTALGDSATAVKTKLLTGTTAATEGGSVNIAHGLTGAKIVSSACLVRHATNGAIFPESTNVGAAGYEYTFVLDSGGVNFAVINSAANSSNILSKPIVIMVWYIE